MSAETFKDCTIGETTFATFFITEKVAEAEAAGGGTVTIPAGEWVNVDGTLVRKGSPAHLFGWIAHTRGVPRP